MLNDAVKALKLDRMNRIYRMENQTGNRKKVSPFGDMATWAAVHTVHPVNPVSKKGIRQPDPFHAISLAWKR
jgi:hypothetical protein